MRTNQVDDILDNVDVCALSSIVLDLVRINQLERDLLEPRHYTLNRLLIREQRMPDGLDGPMVLSFAY